MILPTDEVGFGREVMRRRVGGGVVEEAEGVNFAEPFGRGPGSALRYSGDAGDDPEGGENEISVSSQKRRDLGKGRSER